MAILSTYTDDSATSGDDKYLTVNSDGSTRLTPANTLKTYIEANTTAGSTVTADIADGAITSSKLAPAKTVDANGWTIVDLGTISIATKKYSGSMGSLAGDTTFGAFPSVNSPVSGTVLTRNIRGGHTVSGAEILYSLNPINTIIYVRNVGTASIGAGTVTAELTYIVQN